MWIYRRLDGALMDAAGERIATGYSGQGDGLNNPADDAVVGEGPIPSGLYTFGTPHLSPNVGPYAMALTPNAGTDTHRRSAFLIHGDNTAMNHTASHGCIILKRPARMSMWQSDDHTLKVI